MENKTHTIEETFVFYPSFIRQIEAIRNDAVKARLYKAAAEYGCYNVLPDFSDIDPIGTLDGLFEAIKYAIDESKSRRRKTSEIRSNAGRLGGGQPGNSNARKKTIEQNEQKQANESKTSVNVNVNENVDVNENENISTIVDEKSKPKRARRFVAPSLEDVKKFFLENGFTSDPAQFYDHYSANGWLIGGKSKMKDWNAAARNWERRQHEFSAHPATPESKRISPTATDYDAFVSKTSRRTGFNANTPITAANQHEFQQYILNKLSTPDTPEPDLSNDY